MTEQPLEDDMPLDPEAHLYDDSEEGTNDNGVPIKSEFGSEENDAVPDA